MSIRRDHRNNGVQQQQNGNGRRRAEQYHHWRARDYAKPDSNADLQHCAKAYGDHQDGKVNGQSVPPYRVCYG
ncbi:MAG: hypothetical protein FalmKO_10010 [Falsiruegeria mediterranea]